MVPLIFLSLCVTSWAAANTLCKTGNGPIEQGLVKDSCSDDAASFLQLSRHASTSWRHMPKKNFAVAPVDCLAITGPLQVMASASGFVFKELEAGSGTYTDLFDVPFDSVKGGYTRLNACGVNPIDDIIYCVMFAEGPYIVRVDESNVEFVARLPWTDYNTGAFAPSGNFYVSDLNARFLVVKDLHRATSFQDVDMTSAEILDLRRQRLLRPKGFRNAADAVVANLDLQGNGAEEYLFVLYGPNLHIAKYDHKGERFTETWKITVKPSRWDHIYGAGWSFQNQLFFSAKGVGVYRIPMEHLTLKNPPATLQLKKVGPSAPGELITYDDGLNCLNMPSPWVLPFDCSAYPGPIQVLGREDRYDIELLNATTGMYTNIFKIMKSKTATPMRMMNAFSINPLDLAIYATTVIDSWNMDTYPLPPPFYIVRLDKNNIQFLAKVQAAAGSPIAGTFDSKGNYYVVSNPTLFQFPSLHSAAGFDSHKDEQLPFYGESASVVVIKNMTGAKQLADIVAVVGNFDETGETEYVLGANSAAQVVLMKPDEGKHFVVDTADPFVGTFLEGNWNRQNFGAAWKFQNKVFYASNDGLGVFQVPIDEIRVPNGPKISFTNVGPSAVIAEDDGLNCPGTSSPYQ